jgi:hypothetical protein
MIGGAIVLALFVIRLILVYFSVPRTTPVWDASVMAIMIPKGLAAAVLAAIPRSKRVSLVEILSRRRRVLSSCSVLSSVHYWSSCWNGHQYAGFMRQYSEDSEGTRDLERNRIPRSDFSITSYPESPKNEKMLSL